MLNLTGYTPLSTARKGEVLQDDSIKTSYGHSGMEVYSRSLYGLFNCRKTESFGLENMLHLYDPPKTAFIRGGAFLFRNMIPSEHLFCLPSK